MKRYHVLGIVFFAGVIMAAAVLPAHAETNIQQTYVQSLDKDDCTVNTPDGAYAVEDCDDMDSFSSGDFISVIHTEGLTVLRAEDGSEAFVDEL